MIGYPELRFITHHDDWNAPQRRLWCNYQHPTSEYQYQEMITEPMHYRDVLKLISEDDLRRATHRLENGLVPTEVINDLTYPSLLTLAAGIMQARRREELARRVCRQAQEHHWPWLKRVTSSDVMRFGEKVQEQAQPPGHGLEEPCRVWTGGVSHGGQRNTPKSRVTYGTFWTGSASVRAHLFAAIVLGTKNGLPHLPGRHVDHYCEVSLCVEPSHLESVPEQVNLQRRWAGHEVSRVDGD